MSAFVSGHQHDVFVSYAHVDNQPLFDGQDGWVTSLRTLLEKLVNQKLGKSNACRIWMDPRLTGNEPFDTNIEEAMRSAATLLVVQSPGSMSSEWCRRERELFIEANGGVQSALGRVFIVRVDDLPPLFPNVTGYAFFQKDPVSGDVQQLGFPTLDPNDRLYFQRLLELAGDLADKLQAMSNDAIGGESPASARGAFPVAKSIPRENTIFLSEVTPDLESTRAQIASYLDQCGLRVLPEVSYRRGADEFSAAMDRDLAECVLFVQMLGPYGSRRTEKMPQGYEGLQLERARKANKPILRWRHRDLDLELANATHRQMLLEPDVEALYVQELQRSITDRVKRIGIQRQLSGAAGDHFVLINAASPDMSLADKVSSQLADMNVDSEIIDESYELLDVLQNDDYDAVLLLYGNCPPRWLRSQLRACRRIIADKRSRLAAVYIGPPDEKPPLPLRSKKFAVIDCHEVGRLEWFAQAVQSTEAMA